MAKFHRSFIVVVVFVLVLMALGPGVASAAPAVSPGYGPSAATGCCWYHVQWGDTLNKIALRYGVSTSYLQSLNGIANRNVIYAGQWLRVPCGGWGLPFNRNYYYSSKYGCWGFSYFNNALGRWIFICTN